MNTETMYLISGILGLANLLIPVPLNAFTWIGVICGAFNLGVWVHFKMGLLS